MDWITDHVAIGNHLDAQDTALHQEAGVKSVLSLDGTLQPKQAEEMGLLQIVTTMLIDGRGNDVRVFWGAVDSLEFLAEKKPRVLVQCHAGRSRSAAVVAGYLMRTRSLSLEDAVALIAGKRDVFVHQAFRDLLGRFA